MLHASATGRAFITVTGARDVGAPGSRAAAARPYSALARSYDSALGIPYFQRTRRAFERIVARYALRFESAADIGCGTGLFAKYLSDKWGVPVFAVDISRPMLRIAAANCLGNRVVILHQDMRCLRLPRPVDLITANYDALNHLLRREHLMTAIRRIAANLRPGGHFIFDLITPFQSKPRYVVRIRNWQSRTEHRQYISWDSRNSLLRTTVKISQPSRPVHIVEKHVERAYAPDEVGRWLSRARFVVRAVLDADTMRIANRHSSRVIFVCRKSGSDSAVSCRHPDL